MSAIKQVAPDTLLLALTYDGGSHPEKHRAELEALGTEGLIGRLLPVLAELGTEGLIGRLLPVLAELLPNGATDDEGRELGRKIGAATHRFIVDVYKLGMGHGACVLLEAVRPILEERGLSVAVVGAAMPDPEPKGPVQ